jgi:hypothetical protein
MDQKLKEEILAYITNVEHTMRSYRFSLTNKEYIDPVNHLANIEKINILTSNLKEKLKKL